MLRQICKRQHAGPRAEGTIIESGLYFLLLWVGMEKVRHIVPTWQPRTLLSRDFSMNSEEYFMDQK